MVDFLIWVPKLQNGFKKYVSKKMKILIEIYGFLDLILYLLFL